MDWENDELKNAQKHLFRKVQKENVLNVQEQVIRKLIRLCYLKHPSKMKWSFRA